MPNTTTHIHFIKNNYKKQLNKKELEYLISGAIYPDIYYFFVKSKKYSFGEYLHRNTDFGVDFSKKLIKTSKNKYEKLFSIGMLSHFILDKYIHNYFKKNKIFDSVNHLILEHFLDIKYKPQKIPVLKIPYDLINKNLDDKEFSSKIRENYFHKLLFIYYNRILRFVIKKKYKNKKATKKITIYDIVLWVGYSKPLKKVHWKSIKNIIYPDYKLKEKHFVNIITEKEKAKKEFLKNLKTI